VGAGICVKILGRVLSSNRNCLFYFIFFRVCCVRLVIGFDCELFHLIVFLWVIVGALLLEIQKYISQLQIFRLKQVALKKE